MVCPPLSHMAFKDDKNILLTILIDKIQANKQTKNIQLV